MFQAGRLAMAIYPDERARPGRTPVVGLGGRDPGDGEWRRGLGGGSATRGSRVARSATLVGPHRGNARPAAPPAVVAPGLVVVPGLSDHDGRLGPAAALHPRALAGDTGDRTGGSFPSEYLGIQ